MRGKLDALKAAFPYTTPILAGFLFLGAAYGMMMHERGFAFWWPCLMSAVIFAGSMEFVTVGLLCSAFEPTQALLLALTVNARHLFYGVSMLEKYRGTGRVKPYLIFGLCDETFSINCFSSPPEGVEKQDFYFFVTLFNQLYWVAGATLGGLLGGLLPFSAKGIDFVMTALFVVIFMDQWKTTRRHAPALLGLAVSAVCLVIFGAQRFLLPAMGLLLVILGAFRGRLEEGEEAA